MRVFGRPLCRAAALALALGPGLPAMGRGADGGGMRAADVSAGSSLTLGSRGYRRFALFSDVGWVRGAWEPYAWAELAWTRAQRALGFGAGAWRLLGEGWRVKGGLGLTALSEESASGSVFSLDTGLAKDSGRSTFGGALRYARGTLGERAVSSREAHFPSRGRGAAVSVESQTWEEAEAAAYGRLRLARAAWELRLALAGLSYSGPVLSESLSVDVPLAESWLLYGSWTLEQGEFRDAYVSLGASYLF